MFYDPVFQQNGKDVTLSNLTIKKYFQKKSILYHLYQRGIISNPEICKLTNMSSPSVQKILNELIANQLVREEGAGQSIGGRRPLLYGLKPEGRFVVGMNIGHKSTQGAVFNFKNQMIGQVFHLHDHMTNSYDFLDKIAAFIQRMIAETGAEFTKVLGVGIGLTGLINPAAGMSYSYLNFGEKSVKQILEEKLDKPVFLDNDARIMALGEYAFGLARGRNHVLSVNIGSGIGLGMILNGRLYQGNSGFAGEFGHLKLAEDGPLCICGKKGCLETMASGDALVRIVKEGIEAGKSTKIMQLVQNDADKITPAFIVEAARQGDQCSIDALSQIGEYLGKGLASLIHLFNPEAIILGGEIAAAKNFIIDPIQNTLNKYTIFQIKSDTTILTSDFGEGSVLYGALALVMENIFEDIKKSC